METKKKQFKYYAIRNANMVIFRRTVGKITRVKSVLYRPRTDFRLEQVTYTGGKVVGCMRYLDWHSHIQMPIVDGSCKAITRLQFRSLDPYISKISE